MGRVFSAIFWTFFAVSSLLCLLVAFVLWVVTTPFDRERRINHLFSCAWAYLYAIAYPGWDVSVMHRQRIQPNQPYLMVANHTSIADIVLCFGLFRQFKWVSKQAMFNTPVLGWNMRMSRYIPLVRGDKSSIDHMLNTCRFWLRRGISIMMFPEGTRSEDGNLRPFKHGAFTLAQELNIPVVPIAIHGGHALIPKHGKSFAAKARLVVEVLDPVEPGSFASPQAFAEATRTAIALALNSEHTRSSTPRQGSATHAQPTRPMARS